MFFVLGSIVTTCGQTAHLVGQHGSWDNVSNGKDAGHCGLELAVHLDAAALVNLNTNLIQTQVLRVGLAA